MLYVLSEIYKLQAIRCDFGSPQAQNAEPRTRAQLSGLLNHCLYVLIKMAMFVFYLVLAQSPRGCRNTWKWERT
jgi:hypothetical protein